MVASKKTLAKDEAFIRLILITVLGFMLLASLIGISAMLRLVFSYSFGTQLKPADNCIRSFKNLELPEQNELSIILSKHNHKPPRNLDLYPKLPKDHIVIVLYVHNRPKYLRIVVDSLSSVSGINKTLLVVSHDGYYEEMDKIVQSIKFCRVKQIFAPYSPHIFPDRFPGPSPFDCKDKEDQNRTRCEGNADRYGNYRSPKIASLKHHWWWMMNTVWDGLEETRDHSGHILFIEEDHFVYPNAYHNLQLLTQLKATKCPQCYAVNLAPSNVQSRGEGWKELIAEKIGNVGFAFNHTVWRKIHRKAREFCMFDDYNWDLTMWSAVYPTFGEAVYTLRGPRSSAVHFGKCGLHQGRRPHAACIDNEARKFEVKSVDRVTNINSDWGVFVYHNQGGYQDGFQGWGGWGDVRDHQLCLSFSNMYQGPEAGMCETDVYSQISSKEKSINLS
ncbi:alpha-1,6-mannosyl-glycoprotein 2-beta-N-acetylglucosaminyltransferase-like [Andrographis paniculata]|uniref:alpha-1,6-mannosyl-glycoprotein 2-beta-N-acetylglucosaminyltransferase-like n=1 Tax=Andrographis paniculata TaxID=175694 RepID=UPI0021E97DA8|nr:alpha-1,6-mannosyl-glycoprotein 2-beta-N-acetylglucosaminyltransferase-like [Andrographis paniculata]